MKLLDKIIEMGFPENKADSVIRTGSVLVNNVPETLPHRALKETDEVRLKVQKEFVSRGAYKLLSAIEEFGIDFKNKVVLDIGSSTGGFTEVALKNGALHVFALDVGTNQLDFSLRRDDRVTSMEKTNLKTITKEMFDKEIDIVVTDVSFISLKHVFNVIENLNDNLQVMALIKPQFEANSDQVQEGGVVDIELHQGIIDKIIKIADEKNFDSISYKASPISGGKSKNIEYISYYKKR